LRGIVTETISSPVLSRAQFILVWQFSRCKMTPKLTQVCKWLVKDIDGEERLRKAHKNPAPSERNRSGLQSKRNSEDILSTENLKDEEQQTPTRIHYSSTFDEQQIKQLGIIVKPIKHALSTLRTRKSVVSSPSKQGAYPHHCQFDKTSRGLRYHSPWNHPRQIPILHQPVLFRYNFVNSSFPHSLLPRPPAVELQLRPPLSLARPPLSSTL
jgi:hypothetical protein